MLRSRKIKLSISSISTMVTSPYYLIEHKVKDTKLHIYYSRNEVYYSTDDGFNISVVNLYHGNIDSSNLSSIWQKVAQLDTKTQLLKLAYKRDTT